MYFGSVWFWLFATLRLVASVDCVRATTGKKTTGRKQECVFWWSDYISAKYDLNFTFTKNYCLTEWPVEWYKKGSVWDTTSDTPRRDRTLHAIVLQTSVDQPTFHCWPRHHDLYVNKRDVYRAIFNVIKETNWMVCCLLTRHCIQIRAQLPAYILEKN